VEENTLRKTLDKENFELINGKEDESTITCGGRAALRTNRIADNCVPYRVSMDNIISYFLQFDNVFKICVAE
jgi:hypothetical protein